MTVAIDSWVVRVGLPPQHTGRVLGKPHYVESVIDDEPITHCGRRLRTIEGTRLIQSGPIDPCEDCRPMLREDDGSTHDEMVPSSFMAYGPHWTTLRLANDGITV